MVRRLGWLLTLAPIGVASLVYVVVVRGFLGEYADHGLAWPLLGILPTFVFGMWLLTVTSARSAVFIAVAATAMAVGAAYETLIQRNLEWISEPWFPLFNTIGLTADAVATAGFISLFATFPTGVPERRWQRFAVWLIWIPVLVGPLALFTSPDVILPTYAGVSAAGVPNQFAVPWLEWAAPAAYLLTYDWFLTVVVGLGVLYYRALFGDVEVRARTRVMTWVVTAALIAFGLWELFPDSWIVAARGLRHSHRDPARRHPRDPALRRVRHRSRRPRAAVRPLVGPAHRGPVRDRRRDAGPPARRQPHVRRRGAADHDCSPSASCRCAAWSSGGSAALVFGDRERQLTMLSELGIRLEKAVDPGELLTRLAEAVREGLDASWVRITLAGSDGALAATPTGAGR